MPSAFSVAALERKQREGVLGGESPSYKGDFMNWKVWLGLVFICVALGGMYVYSDYVGNPEMQRTVSELFKIAIGAIIGATANAIAK